MLTEEPKELHEDSMDVGEGPCTSGRSDGKVFRIGCALLPKKVSRYLTTAMRTVARSRGLELILIDHNKSLLDQGTYDAIVHKLRPNKDWERNLQEYIKAHPRVKVIDSLAGIRIVHNRGTMLLPLRERPEGIALQKPRVLGSSGGFTCARIQSPTQVDIAEGTSLAEAQQRLQQAGLRPPLLVKPLWTDGREGSHGLAVLHDMAALGKVLQGGVSSSLQPPLVVQQFVEHGGVLFKVYVLGTRTVVCRRPSLGDSYLGQEARRAGVLSLPRISCKSTFAKGSPEDRFSAGMLYNTTAGSMTANGDLGDPAETWFRGHPAGGHPQQQAAQQQQQQQHALVPPDWVTSALAATLRDKLGLQLFNFDMICPERQDRIAPYERLYYVVDINYFPGVDKIPNFEHIFVDFLTDACGADADGNGDGDGDHNGNCEEASAGDARVEEEPSEAIFGEGDDGLSSVSSDKGDRVLACDAPAPAAEMILEAYELQGLRS